MKSSNLLFFLVMVVLAWEGYSAPAECPDCVGQKKDNTTLICAQEESEFQGSFANFCELLRFNCMNNRRYYVVTVGERCKSDQAWTKVHNLNEPEARKIN